jgi:hypothetical protein
MATYTSRTVTSTRHEWIVPAAEPWGAPADEIGKAWAAAEMAYREANNMPEGGGIAGNALAFHVTDDAVVIAFTTETPAGGTP